MSTCSFTMETGTDISYCATGVMYVSLNLISSIFRFQTTEITNNILSPTIFDNSAADITYFVEANLFPSINPMHAAMSNALSEGEMINDTSYNTLKFDKIFYDIEQAEPGTLWWYTNLQYQILPSSGYNILTNTDITGILDDIELFGWNQKISTETTLSNANNNGNGLTNSNSTEDNVTRVLLKQLAHFDNDRLNTTNKGGVKNSINNTTGIQNFPFIEGDTINYFTTFGFTDSDIPDRKYRILLYLTNFSTNINVTPVWSLVDRNDPTVTDKGIPTITTTDIEMNFPPVFENKNIEATPAYGDYNYSQTGIIYLSSEINKLAGNYITGIELNFNDWDANYPLNNQVIKMSHIISTEFNGTNLPDYSDLIGKNNINVSMITVKSSFNMTIQSSSHWKRFDFDTHFLYDGTNNLLISWENRDGSWQDDYGHLEGLSTSNDTDGSPAYRVTSWYDDNNYPSNTNFSSPQNRLPNIIFHYIPSSATTPASINFPSPFGYRNVKTMPAYGNYDYSQTGMIYLSSEVGALKERQITGIELNFDGWSTDYPLNNQVIKMGHVSANEFNGTNLINYSDISGQNNIAPTMTTVKTSFDITIESSSHWKRFDFDTNFYYNGTSNLLISWENRDGSWQDGYGHLEGTSTANDTDGTPSYRVTSWFDDNNYPSNTNFSSPQNRMPNIIFHFLNF